MSVRVIETATAPMPTATRPNVTYQGAVVEVDDLNHTPHTRRYVSFTAPRVAARPATYRCPTRQKVDNPTTVPNSRPVVRTDWHCACGRLFATYSGLMGHTTDPALPEADHYAL